MTKTCISCGMPLERPEHFPDGDVTKDWCVHCARDDGSLKSYDEALIGMTGFIVHSQGIDEEAARQAAQTMMAQLPAWKDAAPEA